MTEIDFDFQIMRDLVAAYEDKAFGQAVPPVRTSQPTLEGLLRDAISTSCVSSARQPERIRITELVPEGMILVAPFEVDGSMPSLDRRATDGGTQEVLINPSDWEHLVRPYREEITRRMSGVFQPVQPLGPTPPRALSSGWAFCGIPVKDDTIKTRSQS